MAMAGVIKGSPTEAIVPKLDTFYSRLHTFNNIVTIRWIDNNIEHVLVSHDSMILKILLSILIILNVYGLHIMCHAAYYVLRGFVKFEKVWMVLEF